MHVWRLEGSFQGAGIPFAVYGEGLEFVQSKNRQHRLHLFWFWYVVQFAKCDSCTRGTSIINQRLACSSKRSKNIAVSFTRTIQLRAGAHSDAEGRPYSSASRCGCCAPSAQPCKAGWRTLNAKQFIHFMLLDNAYNVATQFSHDSLESTQ